MKRNLHPKDVKALISYAEKIGYDSKLLKEIIHSNERFRGKGLEKKI